MDKKLEEINKIKHRAEVYRKTAQLIPEDDMTAMVFYGHMANSCYTEYYRRLVEYDLKHGLKHNCDEYKQAWDIVEET